MGSKRKPIGNPKLNFRPSFSDIKSDTKGMKPCQDQASITSVFTSVGMHACKSVVFVNVNYRICAYLFALFVISVLADVLPFPRTPFSRKDNFFNVYFVKISWGWTLLTTIPFVVCTSLTYCCGDKQKVVKHLIRLCVATAMWYFWTNTFIYFEKILGRCSSKDARFTYKSECIMKGHVWQSIDISGHSFILIYSALVFIEESRVIINWDSISDWIRKEEFSRTNEDNENSIQNPLRNLTPSEFDLLKDYYKTLTPVIRTIFVVITILLLIWDCMLLTTILYFHNMLEKLLAGAFAIITWYCTYKLVYPSFTFLLSPGDGLFKYRDCRVRENGLRVRQQTSKQPPIPKFMGNPLYSKYKDESPTNPES